MKNISTGLDQFSATYDNLILLGGFNVEPEEVKMLDFLNIYNLKNLVKQKTCYKNPENPFRSSLFWGFMEIFCSWFEIGNLINVH